MFKNVVLPIDVNDRESWEQSITSAIKIMHSSPDAVLHVVTVVQNYGFGMMEEYFPKGWINKIAKKSESELKNILERYISNDFKVKLHVVKGVIYQSIIDLADQISADLIIISASHPERRDYLLGPNAAKVVRHANVSVLVVR